MNASSELADKSGIIRTTGTRSEIRSIRVWVVVNHAWLGAAENPSVVRQIAALHSQTSESNSNEQI